MLSSFKAALKDFVNDMTSGRTNLMIIKSDERILWREIKMTLNMILNQHVNSNLLAWVLRDINIIRLPA